MEFNPYCTGKKRQMLFLPDVNPNSLLFFFEKGNSGVSWSLRDYSAPLTVIERYAREFGWSADEVRRRATHSFDAPTVDIHDLKFWHEYTLEGNKQILGVGTPAESPSPLSDPEPCEPRRPDVDFPIAKFDELRSLPKASKRGDLDRILHSANSEDYVTWNWACLVTQEQTSVWWPRLLDLARRENPNLDLFFDPADLPQIVLWERVSSPRDYEAASRQRMSGSSNPIWFARAQDSQPVEGVSEIDLSFVGRDFIIFVEAKLGCDISLSTTYDPQRDQISRNIDCLLERAGGRRPYFWLFTRDKAESRAYVQLMRRFQQSSNALCSLLPHRDPEALQDVRQNLTTVLWHDLLRLVPADREDKLSREVLAELARRVKGTEHEAARIQ